MINSKKSVALLYTDNNMAGTEIRETTPLTIAKNTISITMHKIQVLMDQRPQHKVSYTEPHRRSGKYTWTYWHRRPLPKYHHSSTDTETINEWDFMKLKCFYNMKDTVNKKK